jgi:hypothetical protein
MSTLCDVSDDLPTLQVIGGCCRADQRYEKIFRGHPQKKRLHRNATA